MQLALSALPLLGALLAQPSGASPAGASPLDTDLLSRGLFSNNPYYAPGIANATWDGQCYYAAPAQGFDASKYVGSSPSTNRPVWYQIAATDQVFEIGCKCVYAKYGSFSNGTVTVENFCTRFGSPSSVKGYAYPKPAYAYGGAGAYQVQFFGSSSSSCPGPNYVVQKVYTDSNGDYQTVIVGGQKFDSWYILSKQQNYSQDQIKAYLKDVAALGNDLKKPYTISDFSGCPAVTSG